MHAGLQSGISIEEAANRAGVRLDILSKQCSDVVSLDLAKFCINWKLIGRRIGLTEADLAAINGDNTTVEEKRVGMLEKWRSKCAYKAIYRTFIEALLAEGRCGDAIEACKVIKAAVGELERHIALCVAVACVVLCLAAHQNFLSKTELVATAMHTLSVYTS